MLEYFLSPAKSRRPFADRRGVVRPLRPPWLRAWIGLGDASGGWESDANDEIWVL